MIRKQGIRHLRLDTITGAEREVLLLGGACSEVFSGPRLAKVLTPAFELQKQAMEALVAGRPAPTLSNHTCKVFFSLRIVHLFSLNLKLYAQYLLISYVSHILSHNADDCLLPS